MCECHHSGVHSKCNYMLGQLHTIVLMPACDAYSMTVLVVLFSQCRTCEVSPTMTTKANATMKQSFQRISSIYLLA